MEETIIYQTPSQIIAYEPIEENGKLIGWSLMWDVVTQEYQTIFTSTPRKIRLIGVYVHPDYRNLSLASLSMNKMLDDHKNSSEFNPQIAICHCNTWKGFSELLTLHDYQEEIIESVCMYINKRNKEDYSGLSLTTI